MGSKAIKVKEENYKWLLKISSDIQKKLGKPVSFDEALSEIKNKIEKKRMKNEKETRPSVVELEG